MGDITVSALWVFPIKSCRGTQVQSWGYGETGLDVSKLPHVRARVKSLTNLPFLPLREQYDRGWMICDEGTHTFLTARTISRMILLEPHLDITAGTLTLRIPAYMSFSASEHTIPITPPVHAEEHYDLKVWSSPHLDGYDVGTPALNRALSDFMGRECRLMKKGSERREAGPDEGWIDALKPSGVELAYDGPSQVSLADQFPILLCSEESLKDIESKVLHDEDIRATPQFDHERWSPSAPPLEMHRWRGNIIVRGGQAWEEDSWGEIEFAGQTGAETETLYVAARCARCMLPNVDPDTGIRDKVVPDRVLRPYREGVWARYESKTCFGVNVVPKHSKGTLHVGDSVKVVRRFKSVGEDRYERPEDANDFGF